MEGEIAIKVEHHVISTLCLSALILGLTRSLAAALGCLVGGVLIDLDHIVDYFLIRGARLDIGDMLHIFSRNLIPKLYLFLHSYEILALVWAAAVFSDNAFLWGFTLGFTLHMALDQWMNLVRAPGYFLIYRAMVEFDKDRICKLGSTGRSVGTVRQRINQTFRRRSPR